MSDRWNRVCAAIVLLIGVVGSGVVLYASYGFGRVHPTVADLLAGAVTSVTTLIFVGVGVVIVLRGHDRGRLIGRLLVLSGLGLLASSVGSGVGSLYQDGHPVPLGAWAAWTDDWVWVLLLLGVWLTLILFPDGRASTRTARVAVALGLAVAVTVLLTFPFTPGNLYDLPGVANPVPPVPVLSALSGPVHAALIPLMLGMFVLSAVCVVLRYRGGGPEIRAQIRWLGWSTLVTVLFVIAQNVLPAPWSDAVSVATLLTMPVLPVVVAISVLRYRLYDIDRLLSRTVSYALLTGLVVAVYVGVVALASVLVPEASGSLGVAVATLAAVSLVRPLRRRLQDVVDRRFDRARSDARRTVADYADRLRTMDTFQEDDLHDVLSRTVAPTTAWLWQPNR
ncbi:hypothetical protein [Pseudonocardia endophytica]|uniref:Uncharacterized protein n=1 Tax=Pseudonocardia endophytica TaxID=401976 RepID=A0A4R1I0D8_PSEEN|nr:hypothetical protein [Pseudonocardia endophytica]TCK26670.1 hypothetical protein EV378_2511 [Pseudonocardia endophytica]